jgi:hypothetical protein
MSTITRYRGDTYPISATIKVNGEPIDITGSTIVFSFSDLEDTPTIISINGVLEDPENGIVRFDPSPTDFDTVGTYKYDIQRTQDGYISTHAVGRLEIVGDITL